MTTNAGKIEERFGTRSIEELRGLKIVWTGHHGGGPVSEPATIEGPAAEDEHAVIQLATGLGGPGGTGRKPVWLGEYEPYDSAQHGAWDDLVSACLEAQAAAGEPLARLRTGADPAQSASNGD